MKRLTLMILFALLSSSNALAESKHRFVDSIIKLDLEDRQKTEIANILKSSRAQIKPKVDSMIEARQKLAATICQDNFDEAAVRAASKDLAKIQEDLAVLRAGATNRVIKVLNPEQKQVLNEMRDKFGGNAKHRLAGFRKLLNHWIDKHAQG